MTFLPPYSPWFQNQIVMSCLSRERFLFVPANIPPFCKRTVSVCRLGTPLLTRKHGLFIVQNASRCMTYVMIYRNRQHDTAWCVTQRHCCLWQVLVACFQPKPLCYCTGSLLVLHAYRGPSVRATLKTSEGFGDCGSVDAHLEWVSHSSMSGHPSCCSLLVGEKRGT